MTQRDVQGRHSASRCSAWDGMVVREERHMAAHRRRDEGTWRLLCCGCSYAPRRGADIRDSVTLSLCHRCLLSAAWRRSGRLLFFQAKVSLFARGASLSVTLPSIAAGCARMCRCASQRFGGDMPSDITTCTT